MYYLIIVTFTYILDMHQIKRRIYLYLYVLLLSIWNLIQFLFRLRLRIFVHTLSYVKIIQKFSFCIPPYRSGITWRWVNYNIFTYSPEKYISDPSGLNQTGLHGVILILRGVTWNSNDQEIIQNLTAQQSPGSKELKITAIYSVLIGSFFNTCFYTCDFNKHSFSTNTAPEQRVTHILLHSCELWLQH